MPRRVTTVAERVVFDTTPRCAADGGERRASGTADANVGPMHMTQSNPNPTRKMGVSTALRFKGVPSMRLQRPIGHAAALRLGPRCPRLLLA